MAAADPHQRNGLRARRAELNSQRLGDHASSADNYRNSFNHQHYRDQNYKINSNIWSAGQSTNTMDMRGLRFLGRYRKTCRPQQSFSHLTSNVTRRFSQQSNLREQASSQGNADSKQKNTSTLFVKTNCVK